MFPVLPVWSGLILLFVICGCFWSWAGLGDRLGQLGSSCFCNGSDDFIVSVAEPLAIFVFQL